MSKRSGSAMDRWQGKLPPKKRQSALRGHPALATVDPDVLVWLFALLERGQGCSSIPNRVELAKN